MSTSHEVLQVPNVDLLLKTPPGTSPTLAVHGRRPLTVGQVILLIEALEQMRDAMLYHIAAVADGTSSHRA